MVFRRNLRNASRLLSAFCARALLLSRMRARVARYRTRKLASFARVAVATASYRLKNETSGCRVRFVSRVICRDLRERRVKRNIALYKASCAVALQAVFRSYVARRSMGSLFSISSSSTSVLDMVHVRRWCLPPPPLPCRSLCSCVLS